MFVTQHPIYVVTGKHSLEMRQDSIQFKGLSETIIENITEIQRAVRNDN